MSSIVLDLLWRDHGAQQGMQNLGKATDVTAARMTKLKAAALIAGGLAGAAIVKFGRDSVKAYSDSQDAQKALGFAFQKFPALADTNQRALQSLNTELQKKTRFDDDNIASGQAVLAQFKLTGTQLRQVTPLLLDYASKTGKDIPQAAQDVGKALLGNAKALKNIGISYKSTGDSATDFTNITGLMQQKIGGFADQEGKTFSGQLAIMKNQFGELEETAGSKLVPALTAVVGSLTDVVMWVGNNSKVIVPLAAGIAGLVGAIWLADKAGKAWAITQGVTSGIATKAVGGLNLLKVAFTGVAFTAEGAGRAMKIAQLAIPGVGIALFAVTTAMQFFASKSDDSTASSNSFADAMESVTGEVTRATAALNENVRAVAVKNLQDKGAFEQAKLLGLSYGTVTDAALGNKAAIEQVNRATLAATGPSSDLSAAHVAASNAAVGLSKTLIGVATESTDATNAENVRRDAMIAGVAPTETLTAVSKKLKGAQADLRSETMKLLDSFTLLRDGALSQDRANSAWQESLDAAKGSVKSNRAALDDLVKSGKLSAAQADKMARSLSNNTARGRANRETVRTMITALNDKVVSDGKASHSTAGLSDKMKDGEAKIRAAAKAAGYNKDQVDAMIRKMLKTPKQVETDIKTPGMNAAQNNVDSLGRKIKGLDNKTVSVKVHFGADGKISIGGGPKFTAAQGGVLPGWSPGRDIHEFYSPTGGRLALSGGEAVMRPEFTKALGVGGVQRVNAAAKNGGASAVRAMMGFADGGVVSRNINIDTGTGGSVPVSAAMSAAVNAARWAGNQDAHWAAKRIVKYVKDQSSGGPIAGGGYVRALNYAKRHAGHPYRFGTIWDCSGFMSSLDAIIHGHAPHRLFSTMSFRGQQNGPGGFHKNKKSAFMVGVHNGGAGGGHMAGTLNGVNVESSGGRGVHYGRGARGAHSGMFGMHYGLANGGIVGDLPWDTINPQGNNYNPAAAALAHALYGTPVVHDRGGMVQPGTTLVHNGTGQPERMLNPQQNRAFENMARVASNNGGAVVHNHYTVIAPNYVGPQRELLNALVDMHHRGALKVIQTR